LGTLFWERYTNRSSRHGHGSTLQLRLEPRATRRLDDSRSHFLGCRALRVEKLQRRLGCCSIAGLFTNSIGVLAIYDNLLFSRAVYTHVEMCVHQWNSYSIVRDRPVDVAARARSSANSASRSTTHERRCDRCKCRRWCVRPRRLAIRLQSPRQPIVF